MRYAYICVFLLVVPVPLALLEGLFSITGSGLSIFDTRGAGQVAMLLTVLLMVLAFMQFVARDSLVAFFNLYMAHWKRALAGFLTMLAFAWAVVIGAYAIIGALGYVNWSAEGWAAMNLHIMERAIVAVLVVLVLATTEELMFRVFLMRFLRWNTSAAVTVGAVVFSSFVFASLHKLTDPLAWFTAEEFKLFIGLFLLGVLLCVTYIVTGAFWCAVAIHSGLLGSKAFLRKTGLIEVEIGTSWWIGDSADLRRAPVVWLLFVGLAVAIVLMRRTLNAKFAVERPVVSTAKRPRVEGMYAREGISDPVRQPAATK